MTFKVEFSARAQRDLAEIAEYIHQDSPVNAERWRHSLEQKLVSLTTLPEACAYAPENDRADAEIRQFLFGQYRILFTIRDRTVYLLTIRHGARKTLSRKAIDEIE